MIRQQLLRLHPLADASLCLAPITESVNRSLISLRLLALGGPVSGTARKRAAAHPESDPITASFNSTTLLGES